MSVLKRMVRPLVIHAVGMVYGRDFRAHRIPMGPLKGRRIYMCATQSVRMLFGMDEPALAQAIAARVEPGDVVYDIGAHVGYTALLFAQTVGATGAVHAFELLPSTAALLQKTVDANPFSNITVHNAGMGREACELTLRAGTAGMATLYDAPGKSATPAPGVPERCQIATLDEYAARHGLPAPTVVKLDIERAEVDCLLGGAALFQAHRPALFIEFHTLELLKSGMELLGGWGYRFETLDGVPMDASRAATLGRFHETLLCTAA